MARTTTSGAFLERVSKFPRIINVTQHPHQAANERTATPGATITADCTATTFVLVEARQSDQDRRGKAKAAASNRQARQPTA